MLGKGIYHKANSSKLSHSEQKNIDPASLKR